MKGKTHTIISTDTEKAFDKIQYLFVIKTLSILGIDGNFLNLRKGINERLISDIRLNGKKN